MCESAPKGSARFPLGSARVRSSAASSWWQAPACGSGVARKGDDMLWTIALVLIVLWVLGVVSSYTLGGLVHVLLVIAVVVILIRVLQGRKIQIGRAHV